jgi:subtilase family serine protease
MALSVALVFLSGLTSLAASRQTLEGHIPELAKSLSPVGRLSATNRLELEIGLPYRNQSEFANLVSEIYDPASTNFHHYLTPEQFIEHFAPSPTDYQAVIDFARAHNLAVTKTFPDFTLLVVTGSVADIEAAFHLNLRLYPHPTEHRNFFAPDAEPSLDLDVAVLDIAGLDNFVVPHPMNLVHKSSTRPANAQAWTGSGPGNNFMGNDFRAAYVPGVTLTGASQSVGLLEFDGYYSNDITAYKSLASLPNVPVNTEGDNFNSSPGGNNVEVALDIDMAISMAPGLTQVIVYEGTSASTILTQMLNDNTAKQLSASWTYSANKTTTNLFQRLGAQGQSFFNAAGDSGAYTGAPAPPTDDPYLTSVGGTSLTTTGPGGAWSSETVWNWFTTGEGNGAGSGGISQSYSLPAWQQGVSMANNQGSTSHRDLPDVALTADNIWVIHDNGSAGEFGGTSVASPLWAAFTALVNQQAASNGLSSVGFLNPALYAIGKGSIYNACFHDITTGNNTNSSTSTKFFAVPGYDLCTGWGTPNGPNLIAALAPGSPFIVQQPANASVLAGANASFSVGAVGLGTLTYHWRFNGTNITGATSSSYTVTNAQNGNQGNYSVVVTNSMGSVTSTNAVLAVDSFPIITSQPQGENLTVGNNASFSVTASGPAPLNYQWQLNGANLSNNARITGSQGSSLAITGILAGDAGSYRVVITNAFGTSNSTAASLTVAKAATTITWSNPAPILYGTALGAVQLNASASQTGVFNYTPPAGTVLNAGVSLLSVVFTPNDPADYLGATNGVSLHVNPAPLTVTASNAARIYGQPNPVFTASIAGATNGDIFTATASCSAAPTNLPGTYPIVPGISDPNNRLTNYNVSSVNGTLTITPAPAPTITGIDPGSGSTNGGTSVSVFGTGFENGATVTFGSIAAVSVTVSNATNLIAVTPANATIGDVDVIVTNADGQSVDFTNGFTYTASQVIGSAPLINAGPSNQVTTVGGSADFTVTAGGSGTLVYQWLFNSASLSGATNSSLAFTNVQSSNAGPYYVIVTNLYGAATSSVATLSVSGLPVSFASPTAAQYSNGQFVLQISGLTGQGPVVIQSSTDFVNWLPIFTNPPGFGQFQFIDTNAGNAPFNYYRAVTPPSQ